MNVSSELVKTGCLIVELSKFDTPPDARGDAVLRPFRPHRQEVKGRGTKFAMIPVVPIEDTNEVIELELPLLDGTKIKVNAIYVTSCQLLICRGLHHLYGRLDYKLLNLEFSNRIGTAIGFTDGDLLKNSPEFVPNGETPGDYHDPSSGDDDLTGSSPNPFQGSQW